MQKMFTFLAIICIATCSLYTTCNAEALAWERINGFAIQISAKGKELWALNDAGHILRYNGSHWSHTGPYDGATRLGDTTSISAAADGVGFITNAHLVNRANIWRYNPAGNNFVCTNNGIIAKVNAYMSNSAVGVTEFGCTWFWDGNGWTNIRAATIGAYEAAIGENKEIWIVDQNGLVFRYENNVWVPKLGKAARHIDVENASRVVMTDANLNIYVWNDPDWNQLEGIQCAHATINKQSVFCLDPFGGIWKTDM